MAQKGNRKQAESREVALMMLCGFGAAAYFKADAQLFGMLILGLLGKSAGFMWGNTKEHEAEAKVAVAEVKP